MILVCLVCACGTAAPEARTAAISPPTAPAVAGSPTPKPSPIPFSPPGFTCRLPITVAGGQVRSGGFIDLPAGSFTPDPSSVEVNAIVRPGRALVDQTYSLYFDRAYARWLPVHRNAVSPDGSHYAYADRPIENPPDQPNRATLHVVAVKGGSEVTFDGGDVSDPYVVLDYAAEGIYLVTFGYRGLWLMDPQTGDVTQVAYLTNVQGSAGHGFFWVGAVNPSDPHPVAGTAPDELDRLNPVDGTRVAWFYRPGSSVHFVSQDTNGDPIVIVGTAELNSVELLFLPGPGISRSIQGPGGSQPDIADPLADSHGVWFGGTGGVYLYTAAAGLQQVSRVPGYPANGCL